MVRGNRKLGDDAGHLRVVLFERATEKVSEPFAGRRTSDITGHHARLDCMENAEPRCDVKTNDVSTRMPNQVSAVGG
jgi:hypothetical protein